MLKRIWPRHLRWPALLVGVPLVILLLSVGIWSLYGRTTTNDLHSNNTNGGNSTHASATPGATSDIQVSKGSVSPLLFGTNLSLYDSNDQVLQSASTREGLHQLHFRIIRMPVRPNLSNETEVQAAQAIKSVGAYALVVLRGAVDDNVLADDVRLVNDMNGVFGSTTVFYEYGNEEDLLGVDVSRYTASWNTVVPQLKRLARHGQFIGPVNFQYDRNYLTTFLQHANPRPDQVSWHEYTCDDSWSTDSCLSHIDNWTAHINDARSAMNTAIGTALPIMITEWNYAPNAQANDGKINNDSFMSVWTTKAIQTLAANRVFASMQYACTNSVYALLRSDGTLTAQALTMQSLYSHMILNGEQPTPVSTRAGQVQAGATSTSAGVLSQQMAFSLRMVASMAGAAMAKRYPTWLGGQIYQIGVQFGLTSNTPMSSDVFVDAVGWH